MPRFPPTEVLNFPQRSGCLKSLLVQNIGCHPSSFASVDQILIVWHQILETGHQNLEAIDQILMHSEQILETRHQILMDREQILEAIDTFLEAAH
jgi:hypothetical protein